MKRCFCLLLNVLRLPWMVAEGSLDSLEQKFGEATDNEQCLELLRQMTDIASA